MKRFLITTALTAVLATPVMAASDGDADWSSMFRDVAGAEQVHASDFIGARVYVAAKNVTADSLDEPGDNWEDVGEINDVLFSRDGRIDSILVDVGGFLGMGEKTVAIQMDKLKLVSDGDAPDEYFVVFKSSREALENAPAFEDRSDRAGMDDSDAAMTEKAGTNADGVTGKASMSQKAEMAPEGQHATSTYPAAPEVTMDDYDTVVAGDLKVDDLDGATVYDTNNKDIGEISDLIVNTNGQATDAVIDVGGFLGIGEKPVEVSFDSLTIKRAKETGDVRVYIDASEQQLEDMPEYEG